MIFVDEEPQDFHSPPANLKLSWVPIQHIPIPSAGLRKLSYTPLESLSFHVSCGYNLFTVRKARAIIDGPPVIIVLNGLYLASYEVTVFPSHPSWVKAFPSIGCQPPHFSRYLFSGTQTQPRQTQPRQDITQTDTT